MKKAVDYTAVFNLIPKPALLLLPDAPAFTIICANEAYCKATSTSEKDLNGYSIFDAFPDSPEDLSQGAVSILQRSLLEVIATGENKYLQAHRYDIPVRGTDRFEIRYWNIENIPVKNASGEIEIIMHSVEDITELHLFREKYYVTQQALLQTELRFKNVFDYSATGIALVGLDGHWLDINQRICDITGYSREELLQKRFQDITHPDSLEADVENMNKLLRGEINQYRREKKYIHKNGHFIWILMNTSLVRNTSGKPLHFVTNLYDITEQKEAELKLQLSEQRFKGLIQDGSDLVAILDEAANYLYVSPTSITVLGTPPEEYVGKNAFDLIHPDDKAQVFTFFSQLGVNKRIYVTPFRFLHKNGAWRWLETVVTDLREDPAIQGIVANSRDITEKINVLNQLRISNERYGYVTSVTTDAIWDWDLINETLVWNEGYKKLFGYENGADTFNYDVWRNNIHPGERATVEQSLQKAFEDKNCTYWRSEYRYLCSDGHYAYVITKAAIVRDEQGKPIRTVGAMTDITQQKLNEATLKNLNTQLEITNKELAVSNEDLEQFAYSASHDLQEPLRMIINFMGMVEKKYNEQLDEKGKQYIHFAMDGALRMRQIIMDLLEYSRVGRLQEKKQFVAIEKIIEEIKILYRKEIEQKQATFQLHALPVLQTHKSPVLQIFQNLIGNALKYSKAGEPVLIEIGAHENGSEWIFFVADNGIGISPEFHEKIFILFQRLQRNEASGTGMGLAITKKIIERMGGKIWVKSEEGKGSTFYFTIKKEHN